MATVLVGAVAGGAIAVAVSIVLRAQMHGVALVDMRALAAAALLLGTVVLVASLIPAHAAARVDPLVVLREE
jgi:ABC-type antimicrobial peptide transport system permease subunit